MFSGNILSKTFTTIGEGFNYPRLDTMMLTTPIAWQGNVQQYSGRLHRDYEGKQDEIIMNTTEKKQETNAIFDSDSYMLAEANPEIVISSPGVGAISIRRMLKGLTQG